MPAKNHLNPQQIEKLQKALREEEKANIRERILILLLLNDGKTQSKIADFLGCSVNKVSYWCVKGDPDNLESLIDERMKGNHKKATDKYIDLLLEIIEKDPQELGYDFGRWTAHRLATYLEESTGIKLSGGQVRRILKQKKYVYLWQNIAWSPREIPKKEQRLKQKYSNI